MLDAAGLADATAVLLTPSDDAVNIYLSVYCRRLKPTLRLVSRIVHHRNHEAIHRAGVDFALSYSTIGAEAVMAIIEGQEFLWLGEDVDVFTEDVPEKLVNKTLGRAALAQFWDSAWSLLNIGDNSCFSCTLQRNWLRVTNL